MSFNVADESDESRLSQAILLYKNRRGASFATVHPIVKDENDGASIGAGCPFDEKALKRLASDLASSLRIKSGILPSNVLSVGGDHIMWWSPPSRRTYFFNTRQDATGHNVGNRCGEALTPSLIFVVYRGSMSVFAVKGKTRPDADTPIFHAPLMNVYEDGTLCMGSMSKPNSTLAESISKWEQGFWDSAFSHPNYAKSVNYKGGLHAFSTDLLDGKFRKFPDRVLRPMKITLQKIVDDLDADSFSRRRR